MKKEYSRTEFEGYTHRFIVEFEVGEPYTHKVNIYANSDSYQKLEDVINGKKSERVLSFKIIHRASKEQDDLVAAFIEESLKNL